MKRRPINDMLDIILDRNPNLKESDSYKFIIQQLAKSDEELTFVDKFAVSESLKNLCAVANTSYERLLWQVVLFDE